MTDDEFLRAQINTDQRAEFLKARYGEDRETVRLLRTLAGDLPEGQALLRLADHIERDVEAKRRIVDLYEFALSDADARTRDPARLEVLEDVLGYMAVPYADQDGYEESWRPT